MALKLAKRAAISPFIVMDVMRAANERAADGTEVLHLEVGQPSTPAPEPVIRAAQAALEDDRLGYTDALGVPELRERIAAHYRDFYGVAVGPERIVVTTGSSGAFLLAFSAVFDAADRVALACPGYPAYRNIMSALEIEPVSLAVDAGCHFQPTVDHLREVDGQLDGLILASPSNPTGSMLDAARVAALLAHCRGRGIRLISDEIYHGITFAEPARTLLALGDDVIVINSFSKYFSMTGWRLGWMVVPADCVRTVECLAQNLFISPPTLAQLAALTVFDCFDELDANVRRYARNREILLDGLPAAGFGRLAPADGAFYLYADVRDMTDDSHALCRRILDETAIAVTPGVDFDPHLGHGFIRFCFAGATHEMEEAARRLADWRRRRG